MESYKMFFKKEGVDPKVKQKDVCFFELNGAVDSLNAFDVYIEFDKLAGVKVSLEDAEYFIEQIKLMGGMPFDWTKDDKEFILSFKVTKETTKLDTLYITHVIRFLYDSRSNDNYKLIGQHLLNLCKFFPDEDRGKLMCVANNCFVNERKTSSGYGSGSSWNTNHSFMDGKGCKVLTTEEIKKALREKNSLFSIFMVFGEADKIPAHYRYKMKKKTKEEYEKVLGLVPLNAKEEVVEVVEEEEISF